MSKINEMSHETSDLVDADYLSTSTLGQRCGRPNVAETNLMLEQLGLQKHEKTQKRWIPTEKGLQYSRLFETKNNGAAVLRRRWSKSVLELVERKRIAKTRSGAWPESFHIGRVNYEDSAEGRIEAMRDGFQALENFEAGLECPDFFRVMAQIAVFMYGKSQAASVAKLSFEDAMKKLYAMASRAEKNTNKRKFNFFEEMRCPVQED